MGGGGEGEEEREQEAERRSVENRTRREGLDMRTSQAHLHLQGKRAILNMRINAGVLLSPLLVACCEAYLGSFFHPTALRARTSQACLQGSKKMCSVPSKRLQMSAADGTETILRLDTDLTGAWSKEGQRSKEWFDEQEAERQSKVQSVRASHILVSTMEMGNAILEQFRSGEDFEELARQISACESTRKEGGNIGWLNAGDEFLDEIVPQAVRQAALRKKPGDVLLIESERGVHLVKGDFGKHDGLLKAVLQTD
eukprot:754745-Hanusia_phi.AAC.4